LIVQAEPIHALAVAAEALGGTSICFGAAGIAAAQGDPLPEFAQQSDDLCFSIAAIARNNGYGRNACTAEIV
jgi:hypothetical protein